MTRVLKNLEQDNTPKSLSSYVATIIEEEQTNVSH